MRFKASISPNRVQEGLSESPGRSRRVRGQTPVNASLASRRRSALPSSQPLSTSTQEFNPGRARRTGQGPCQRGPLDWQACAANACAAQPLPVAERRTTCSLNLLIPEPRPRKSWYNTAKPCGQRAFQQIVTDVSGFAILHGPGRSCASQSDSDIVARLLGSGVPLSWFANGGFTE